MKKHYFLGLAAGNKHPYRQLLMKSSDKDLADLTDYLSERYDGEAMLCKNGRSALTLALKAYFNEGDAVIINGFTCYAVYEAVKAAGLTPIFADISEDDLNFNVETLEKLWGKSKKKSPILDNPISGIIVQNTLGNTIDMKTLERFAGRHGLIIIEDLAHAVGVEYPDGREVGTVGAATVLSFGKDKAIDAVSGGAVVFRHPRRHEVEAPNKVLPISNYLREKWYPVFGLWCRRLTRLKLGGILMKVLIGLHFVERSADNKLNLKYLPTSFEAKLALEQLKKIKENSKKVREYYLVHNRDDVLMKLKKAGYYFSGFWYEKPVSPERYYKKVHFDEEACPIAVEVSQKIINLPNYYSKSELEPAVKIIEEYLEEAKDE